MNRKITASIVVYDDGSIELDYESADMIIKGKNIKMQADSDGRPADEPKECRPS